MAQRDITDEREYLEDRRAWRERGLSRRELLRAGAAGALLLGAGGVRLPDALAQAPAPPIVKPLPPEWFIPIGTNAEMRWEAMAGQGYLTPAARFFVRNHTATPRIDPRTWRLQVFGSGLRRPEGVAFGLRDLHALPSERRVAFIECAGNGRSFFASQQGTPATGSQWGLGAVGVAEWRGVPLGALLDRAGISRRAVDVLPEGLDATVVSNGVDQGHVRRPLPVGKALDDVLVAYEMNGAPLPPDHGAPARLVVPGWVGIASIKWLGRIEVADRPLFSPWNTTQYRMTGGDYPADSPPLTAQQVKSAFELRARRDAPRRAAARAPRPLVVRCDRDPARRRPDRGRPPRRHAPRPAPRAERARARGCGGPSTGGRPVPAPTRCWRARPTGRGRRSPTRCRSTPTATSSGPSSATR